MSSESTSLLSTTKCVLQLDIDAKFPTDAELTTAASKCAMQEADTSVFLLTSPGSCYAEVLIDYEMKKMHVKLTHVDLAKSPLDPYDDMFGLSGGIESVLQYKIEGDLENKNFQMIARIQCKTSDNCALERLRQLLPTLVVVNGRNEIFNNVIAKLNLPAPKPKLTCMNDDDSIEIECKNDEDRCEYSYSKNGLTKGCATNDSGLAYDMEYRFNVIEKMADPTKNDSNAGLKCSYLCKSNNCNSDDLHNEVSVLLQSLALLKPKAHTAHPTPTHSSNIQASLKSDSVSFITSFNYRSIIIGSLFIHILFN